MKKMLSIFIMLFYSSLYAQTEAKVNMLTLPVLIPNIGLEFQIGEQSSFQLDALFSFWDSIDGSPLHVIQVFPEYRHYFKPDMRGFFIGAHVGVGMFTLTKYGYPNNIHQSGQNLYFGTTIGYKMDIGEKWAIEAFIGGGNQDARYRGYDFTTGERIDVAPENNVRPFNKSGEWLIYRGGVMLIYKIPSLRKANKSI